MCFDLKGGSMYIIGENGEYNMFADNMLGSAEVQCTTEEDTPVLYNVFNSSASFEIKLEDLELLNNKLCGTQVPTGNFALQYQCPIMVQARWHKKARIRKKWLKRFGMKTDTITVIADAKMLEYHPGYSFNEQYYNNDVFNNFEFETTKHEFIFRPDQLRRDLKIEF